jgi:deoxyribodipyrimidine photolyase-related protein
MVPNVYGMSQYADGGLITTKPYISSSAYIMKMSDFQRGTWCATWDALFWRFVHKHREFFGHNVRTRMMVLQLNRMPSERLKGHLATAERFLERIWSDSRGTGKGIEE